MEREHYIKIYVIIYDNDWVKAVYRSSWLLYG